jgi:hypothetical protein
MQNAGGPMIPDNGDGDRMTSEIAHSIGINIAFAENPCPREIHTTTLSSKEEQ